MTARSSTALDSAWQSALAAEHQAVFGYGLLGPRLSGAQSSLAVACSDAHEALRDATEAALTAAGRTPVATRPDYPALYPAADATAARELAIRLEADCAAAWRYLYLQAASTRGTRARALRARAQGALTASAIRGARWRTITTPAHATTPFPGI
jgi:hypothetical protein